MVGFNGVRVVPKSCCCGKGGGDCGWGVFGECSCRSDLEDWFLAFQMVDCRVMTLLNGARVYENSF